VSQGFVPVAPTRGRGTQLARLWQNAWELGKGDAKLKAGKVDPPALVKCYGKTTFLKSFLLTEIESKLKGVPAAPK
jgi:hypothetical protein